MGEWADVADLLEAIGPLVHEVRAERSLSLREAAEEIDISFNTLARVERGGQTSVHNAIVILQWLDRTAGGRR